VGTDADWQSASAGDTYSVAIKLNGTMWAWGDNESGQLGDGTTTTRLLPVQVGTDTDWAVVSAGMDAHTLALKKDGTLWAFGFNWMGQLGTGTDVQQNTPVRIGGAADWARIAAGFWSSLATKSDGSLWAWGQNDGLWGNGKNEYIAVPVRISDGWQDIAMGGHSALATRPDGSLWAFGNNLFGQLGQGDAVYRSTPFAVP
jgi:alpha-tubulin suppressor-like RCC1 family protein